MFDHFYQQKHWTTGKHIKVPNHYQVIYTLSFIAHHLVSVFISIKKCQELQLCREIQLAGYLSFGKTIKNKGINTFTARFPSASYVKQQTFKPLCVQKLPVLQDVNTEFIWDQLMDTSEAVWNQYWALSNSLHMWGSASMTIPNNTPASLMSPETCPLGISASFCLSDSFFVSLCSQEHTIYTNAQKYTHRQTHAMP